MMIAEAKDHFYYKNGISKRYVWNTLKRKSGYIDEFESNKLYIKLSNKQLTSGKLEFQSQVI